MTAATSSPFDTRPLRLSDEAPQGLLLAKLLRGLGLVEALQIAIPPCPKALACGSILCLTNGTDADNRLGAHALIELPSLDNRYPQAVHFLPAI